MRSAFPAYFLLGAGLSLSALVGWAMTFRDGPRAKWVRIALIGLLPLELFGFAWDERRQADAKLYFPRVPVLEQLAALPQGRVWGVSCLPPNLNQMCGLEDVRGYDAVDPRNYFRLFEIACDRQTHILLLLRSNTGRGTGGRDRQSHLKTASGRQPPERALPDFSRTPARRPSDPPAPG